MLLGHINFSLNNMKSNKVKNSLQKYLHSVKQVILPPLCFYGITSQRKSVKQRNYQNLPHIPYLNHHDTQDIKPERGQPSKEYFFVPEQQTQSAISHTIPKQQTIQGLKNIVSKKPLDVLSIRAYFKSRNNEFKVGKLKRYLHKWK